MISTEQKKQKSEKFKEFITTHYTTVAIVIFMLQVVTIPFKIFTLAIFLFFLNVISYIIGKDFIAESGKKLGHLLLKVGMVVCIQSIIIIPILKMNGLIGTKSLLPFAVLLSGAVAIGSFAFFMSDKTKEKFQALYDNSVLEKFGINLGPPRELTPGDSVLCINKETKKPVIIKAKDRFLHMLILGPTGSGKTSQILLPMILQDMDNLECGITVLEPKADLAEKVHMMALRKNRPSIYFNPVLPDCPYFNPLYGEEDSVIENMATTFKMLNPDSPQFFLDMNETLIRYSLKVLKRMYGNKATMIELSRFLINSQGYGRQLVTQFSRIKGETAEITKENGDISGWFQNEYFNEKAKTYEHCSGLRSQVAKITSNKHLRRVLNPPNGENDVNFEKHLLEGGVLAIATAQGTLRDLGRFLGYFLILSFQSAVFKRPGTPDNRRQHFLYIDEFQVYSNPGFSDMLTQGRSYVVASHLATQNRALIGMGSGRDGQDFIELVSTNARNIVMFPGCNSKDAKYYSEEFGEVTNRTVQKGISRAKFNPLYGIQKISYPNESIRETEVVEAKYSPSDIIYLPMGEITYRIMDNNSVQAAEVGKIEYIPKELNEELDIMIVAYNEEQEQKRALISLTPHVEETTVTEVADIVAKKQMETQERARPMERSNPAIVFQPREVFDDFEDEDDNTEDDRQLISNPKSVISNDPLAMLEDETFDDLI